MIGPSHQRISQNRWIKPAAFKEFLSCLSFYVTEEQEEDDLRHTNGRIHFLLAEDSNVTACLSLNSDMPNKYHDLFLYQWTICAQKKQQQQQQNKKKQNICFIWW